MIRPWKTIVDHANDRKLSKISQKCVRESDRCCSVWTLDDSDKAINFRTNVTALLGYGAECGRKEAGCYGAESGQDVATVTNWI